MIRRQLLQIIVHSTKSCINEQHPCRTMASFANQSVDITVDRKITAPRVNKSGASGLTRGTAMQSTVQYMYGNTTNPTTIDRDENRTKMYRRYCYTPNQSASLHPQRPIDNNCFDKNKGDKLHFCATEGTYVQNVRGIWDTLRNMRWLNPTYLLCLKTIRRLRRTVHTTKLQPYTPKEQTKRTFSETETCRQSHAITLKSHWIANAKIT